MDLINQKNGAGGNLKNKKAMMRVHCGCGWEKWIKFNPDMSNEEAIKLTEPVMKKHQMKAHGMDIVNNYDYVGSTKIKI